MRQVRHEPRGCSLHFCSVLRLLFRSWLAAFDQDGRWPAVAAYCASACHLHVVRWVGYGAVFIGEYLMPAPLDWNIERARIAPLLHLGMGRAEMAAELGITVQAMAWRLHRLGLTRVRHCTVRDGSENHNSENRATSGRGNEYLSSPGRVEKESIRRRCCRCRKSFIATSRFLFRCAPCRRGDA